MNFLERARRMIGYGVPVVSLPPRKKFPPPTGWQQIATADWTVIQKWITQSPMLAFENSNCASVATLNGVWFLDIDDMTTVATLLEKDTGHSLKEIKTLVVKSSGEKRHLYFKHNEASRAIGNIDYDGEQGQELCSVRANGKYVVSPGSIHPETGVEYKITRDFDIIEAPAWLTDWLNKQKHRIAKDNQTRNDNPKTLIYEGGRDDFLFAEACKLRDTQVSEDAALAALTVVNNERCIPPMDESAVRIKIKSAYTRAPRESRVQVQPEPRYQKTSDLPAPAEIILQRGDTLKLVRVSWLWPGYVALGKVTLYAGNPDNGKSMAAMDLAARVTIGREFPDGAPNPVPPSEVMMLLGEDDLEDTAGPRLVAAGADMKKMIFPQTVIRPTNPNSEVRLDWDLPAIENNLDAHPEIRLLIIDPISNYLGDVSMVAEQEARSILIPLKQMAKRRNLAVVIVMHLNKKNELDAISRVGGAMAFIGVARCSWMFIRDASSAEGEIKDTFSMARIKNNLTKASGSGFSYTITAKPIRLADGSSVDAPYIVWGEGINKTADDVLEEKRAARHSEPGRPEGTDAKVQEAMLWLERMLQGGPQTQKWLKDHAIHEENISEATLRRAQKALGVRAYQKAREWFWELTEVVATAQSVSDDQPAEQDGDDHVGREFGLR